jgi:hypothetical protein
VATQYMITTPEISRPVHYGHCGRLLDDANDPAVPPWVTTDRARLVFGQIAAFLAGMDPLSHRRENGSEPSNLFRRLLQEVKGDPLRRLPADPWEPRELGDQLLDRAHRSERRWKGELRHFAHLGLQHFGRTTLGLSHGGQHQFAEKLGIMSLKDRGINPDGADGAPPIGCHLNHAAAGRGLDCTARELGL